ncbi:MAG: RDD family protein [Arenicellaceae bacterium]|nr:RDD family protein [Arenicellaceae bacterium]
MLSPGLIKRIIIMVYDGLLLAALVMLFFVPFLAVPDTWESTLPGKLFKQLYLVSISYGFFVSFWCKGGQTLGMKSWHLRLVDTDGNPVSFKAANIRYVSAILSWALLGIGYLWILVDKDNLTLHDKLSGTRIVVLKKNSKAGKTKTKKCVA